MKPRHRLESWLPWRWRQAREADLERELRNHLDLEAEAQQEAGLSPKDAEYAARRALGNTARIEEDVRMAWGFQWLETLLQDLRYGLRQLRRNRGFSIVAVLTLALGIGANTAIFTFVDAALLKRLPYPNSGRIVFIAERPPHSSDLVHVHPFNFLEWRARSQSFEALALMQSIPVNTMGPEGAEQLSGLWTTAALARVFQVSPALGRWFTEDETVGTGDPPTAAAHVVILSHAYWQQRVASDPRIIGKTIQLEGQANTVIGVMPTGFRVGTLNPDLYLPMPIDRQRPDAIGSRSFDCYGRLRAGVNLDAAQAEMNVLSGRLGREAPMDQGWSVSLLSLRDHLTKDSRPVLLVLQGVVAFILLIVCSNVAGLLLTRSIGRKGELVVRVSLGASRQRLVQLLGVESLLLSMAGGATGLVLGKWASKLLYGLIQGGISWGQINEAGFDIRILAFTTAASLLTALLCVMIPAWRVSRFEIQTTLRARSRGVSETNIHRRLGSALVVGQVALALILLVGAGLLLRTFSSLLNVRLGFQPERVLTMQLLILGEASERANKVEAILDHVQALPEVRAAGTIQFLPLGPTSGTGFYFDGKPKPAPSDEVITEASLVSRGYFAAMGIPAVEGRPFDERDRIGSPPVCLINQAFAKKYLSGQDPIGRRIVVAWSNEAPTEIVGVVGDIRQALTADPRPTVFMAQGQVPAYITHLVVRTSGDPRGLINSIRHSIHEVDKGQAVADFKTMDDHVSASLAAPRLDSTVVGAFAGLALVLAAVGIFGLISYVVSQRTHEIGIRVALGAQRGDVLRFVVGQGVLLASVGIGIGLLGALWITRFLSSLLYGVSPTDPVTFAAASLLLVAAALVASYIPARRATRVDAIVALRYE
jgi:putative ABC transport system permease protein